MKSIDEHTVQELADLIEPALRTVVVRLGPNALSVLEHGGTVSLSAGEYAALAYEAASAIIDRLDPTL